MGANNSLSLGLFRRIDLGVLTLGDNGLRDKLLFHQLNIG